MPRDDSLRDWVMLVLEEFVRNGLAERTGEFRGGRPLYRLTEAGRSLVESIAASPPVLFSNVLEA